MLARLSIDNLAIIESCEIEFAPGLNILTGETGAGKSIIIGALNLILGDRASSSDVRSGIPRARVEAVFDISDSPPTRIALAALGLTADDADELIVRREISATGRSRHFVNGVSVQLYEVSGVTSALVDLHGQHQHQSLLDVEAHRDALDAYGDFGSLLDDCAILYGKFSGLRARLHSLETDEREAEREKDLLRYQIDEIDGADLQPDEDNALSTERNRLANAETLIQSVRSAVDELYEGEQTEAPASQLVSHALEEAQRLAAIDDALAPIAESLASAKALVDDAAQELRAYGEGVEADPARLQEVEDRIDLIRGLKRKYGDSVEAILEEADTCRERLESLENREAAIEQAKRDLELTRERLGKTAAKLSKKRQTTATRFMEEIVKRLARLNMPSAQCEARVSQTDDDAGVTVNGRTVAVGAHGVDDVEFLISTNAGEAPKPLRKVASGGELSRVMLALKSIMAARDHVPTLVFDEVDAGVSGAVAGRVGEMIEGLSESHQILCITHLPQIAARGVTHFRVEKHEKGGRTVSSALLLDDDGRLDEIASLFSGDAPTPESREHARSLLKGG